MQILALFSVENQYYQPNNNLVAFWESHPSDDRLATVIAKHQGYTENSGVLSAILNSNEFAAFKSNDYVGRINDTDYRLEWVNATQQ